MVRTAVDQFGGLDCAFNNAGIEGAQAPTDECTEENWDRVLTVNLKGVWLCLKHEIAYMRTHGGGAIVNAASVAGLVGFPNIPACNASKGAVRRVLHRDTPELSRPRRVACIRGGPFGPCGWWRGARL